jgi:hypothetical protein
VFLESADAGFIDTNRFTMAFGWTEVDFEIWDALGLDVGHRTRQHFATSPGNILPLQPVSAG